MFDAETYNTLMASVENVDEAVVRDSVLMAGGVCGPVQETCSSHFDWKSGKTATRRELLLPVYHAEEWHTGNPVEMVFLSGSLSFG